MADEPTLVLDESQVVDRPQGAGLVAIGVLVLMVGALAALAGLAGAVLADSGSVGPTAVMSGLT